MELSFIQWLRSRVASHPQVPLGIGDDAALVSLSPGHVSVVTTDMLMDGVDFRLAEVSPRLVGRKSLAVNLSDLAAMGARPVAAFVSVSLPRAGGEQLARELYEGIFELAAEFDTALAGGDTNSWDGPLVINITAVGEVEQLRAFRRGGGQPEDQILVTGDFGGSILGKHFSFTPRLREARWLAEHAEVHAAMDVSDGLTLDLSRLVAECGRGAEIDLHAVPISPAAKQLAESTGKSPLEHALGDGEDFELILAVSAPEAERLLAAQPLAVPLTRIGRLVKEPGLWTVAPNGTRQPLAPRGYEHRLD